MVIGHVDRQSPHIDDSARADALALAFVDIAERVFPGGLDGGGTTGVDFDRDGVAVRVVAMRVPSVPTPGARPAVTDPLSAAELDQLAEACERCPFDYEGDSAEARVWRALHRAVNDLRARRS